MSTLTGLGRLIRFILRRDRLRLMLWIVALSGLTLASAAGLPSVYPDQAAIDSYVALFGDNPALVAFAGPGYGFDDPTIGLVLVNETQINGMIGLALMSIFLVNRNTRAEEDSERAELIRSNVVGRHAPAAAALVVIAGANLIVGSLCGVGFVMLDYQTSGSIALAASMTLVGLLFAGVAAIAAQVASSGRATLGLASGFLGVSFAIRAIGDVADNGLSWLSPIGWAQAVRAYATERWWALGLCLVASGGLAVTAFWLSTKRDLGSGLVSHRPGSARASAWMTKPLGFAFRLQRGAMYGWMAGLFFMGIIFGSIARDIETMVEDNEMMADMFARLQGAGITDSYLASSLAMLGLMAGGYAVSSALRLASEESTGRAEPILATPIGRIRWSLSHIVMAVFGTIAVMTAAGLGVGISYAAITGEIGEIPRMLGAALVVVPAVLLLSAIAVALFGLAPTATRGAWIALGVIVSVGFFGDLLKLPDRVLLISPFEHIPGLPAEDFSLIPLFVLSALAAGLMAMGLLGFERRDIRTE